VKFIFALLCYAALAGCGTVYRNAAEEFLRTQPDSAWGQQPPDGHLAVETSYIKGRLKDPMSAQFEVQQIQKVTISASLTNPKVVPAYMSAILVNAKNSFGGYTGLKAWAFYYSNGNLYAVESEEEGRVYLIKD
jgi:hypothetical protein